MKRSIALIVLISCSFAGTYSEAQSPATRPAIGLAVPTSGEYAPLGKQLADAAALAAAEVGVTLVVADTEGTPARAVAAVTELASRQDVVAIVGPVGQRESKAAASAAQRLAVPLFSLSNAATVNEAGSWIFRVRSSPQEQARALASRARKDLKSERAAILYPRTSYGEAAAKAFAEQYLRDGGKLAAVANYPDDMTDFTEVLDVLVAKKAYVGKRFRVESAQKKYRANASGFAHLSRNPTVDFDVLFIPDIHTRVSRILPFLPVAGIQNGNGGEGVAVQMLGLAAWEGKSMELTGGTAAGALYLDTFAGVASGGRAEEFVRTFEQRFQRQPVDIEAEAFDIIWLLGSIARRMGSRDDARPELIRRLPRRKAWRGVAAGLTFGRSGEPAREFQMLRFDADGFAAPL